MFPTFDAHHQYNNRSKMRSPTVPSASDEYFVHSVAASQKQFSLTSKNNILLALLQLSSD